MINLCYLSDTHSNGGFLISTMTLAIENEETHVFYIKKISTNESYETTWLPKVDPVILGQRKNGTK